MIVLISAEKGGVGKSTIATNLAVHLAHCRVDVALIDTDGQATCARFIERRDEAGVLPPVPCVQRTGDVVATLRDLSRRYQVLVVDAGGRDSREMRSAMAVANLMLVPTRASQADLETLPKVNELISLARSLNPDLKASAVLSMAPSNPAIREVEDARELLSQFEQLQLAGRGVVELENGQARAEIQLLAQEFFELESSV
jgi:chromosome partitioning protein